MGQSRDGDSVIVYDPIEFSVKFAVAPEFDDDGDENEDRPGIIDVGALMSRLYDLLDSGCKAGLLTVGTLEDDEAEVSFELEQISPVDGRAVLTWKAQVLPARSS